MKKILLASILLLGVVAAVAQNSIGTFLAKQPGFSAKQIATRDALFKETYLLYIDQPLDHKHPEKGTFRQRVWLSHFDEAAPVVIVTEGYQADQNYTTELARIIGANQVIVEHRYFEESTPKKPDYQYLTVEQAANDHHAIVQALKQFYKGKWINTGISKGGSTTLFHRAFFPNDVDISIPYVAPINYAREDQRLFDFFQLVGDEKLRAKIRTFQRTVLSRRAALLPIIQEVVKKKGFTFDMGTEAAFELSVLEYPFAYLQWGGLADRIPDANAPDMELVNHLIDGSDISYFSDDSRRSLRSFFHQAYTELGYYAYVPGDLKPLMKAITRDTISSDLMLPGADTLTFRPQTMQYVIQQLRANNPRMIVLVGENDPWGSTAVQAADLSNTRFIINPEGSHLTRIANLPPHLKKRVYTTLEQWLGAPLRQRE